MDRGAGRAEAHGFAESDMPEVTRHERTATLEDSFSVNYKTERKLIRQSSNPTP